MGHLHPQAKTAKHKIERSFSISIYNSLILFSQNIATAPPSQISCYATVAYRCLKTIEHNAVRIVIYVRTLRSVSNT